MIVRRPLDLALNARPMLEGMLNDPKVNRKGNDYEYRSGWNGSVEGQQYKLDIREAKKLATRISALPKDIRGAVLAELHSRTVGMLPAMGSVALSENAAKELTKLSKKLGSDLKFGAHQPRPIHPVG